MRTDVQIVRGRLKPLKAGSATHAQLYTRALKFTIRSALCMQKKEGRLLLRLTASTWRHNPRRRELQSTAGPPGSSGDAGVWKWCKLSKEIAADQFLPELHRKIVFGGRYILGDSAFANSVWLLTPFDAPSTRSQRFFNYKHSQTRFIVEHAFGRLRWKCICLKNRMYFKIEKVPGVVQACCAVQLYPRARGSRQVRGVG